jgi:phage repressor protein C with HTH and peptisase S24 domain
MEPRYFNKEVVLCSPATEWKSGDFCVVKTREGEYLIKRLKKEMKHLILSSLAPGHEPILLPLKDVAGVFKIVWHKEN